MWETESAGRLLAVVAFFIGLAILMSWGVLRARRQQEREREAEEARRPESYKCDNDWHAIHAIHHVECPACGGTWLLSDRSEGEMSWAKEWVFAAITFVLVVVWAFAVDESFRIAVLDWIATIR